MEFNSIEISRYIEIAKKNYKEGKLNEANQIFKNLINKKIYTYDLLVSYGIFNKEIRNFKAAKNLFLFSIKKYPSIIFPYILFAEILRNEGKFEESLKILLSAKNIDKKNSDVFYNLSILYKTNKLFKEAILCINKALKISSDKKIYSILKADILIEISQNQKAEKLLNSLNIKDYNNLYLQKEILVSKLFINQKNYKKAEDTLLKLKLLFNNQRILYLNLSDLYFLNKDLIKGIEILKEGLKIFPDFIPFKFNLAVMYRNSGDINLSIETHIDILKRNNSSYDSYYELSTFYDFSKHESQLKDLKNVNVENLDQIQKINISFAKANIYHYQKDFTKSSYFLKFANDEKLKIQASDFKIKFNIGELYRDLRFNNSCDLNKNSDKTQYIFIVGMPRCGSTLLESILSLNSDVKDMGEVFYLEESLKETKDIREVNKVYRKKIMNQNSMNCIYTDKNLFNFFYCSLIYNFFPNAKIIHCTRNPLDNILSIYRTNFLNQSFSSSLNDIAQLYIYHVKLMNEYKSKFGSIIYSYRHEDVVQNPEENIHKLINWLNWEWDEKYASPHINKRNVFTASSAQVRRKINSQSIGKWNNYKELLDPVIELISTCDLLNV